MSSVLYAVCSFYKMNKKYNTAIEKRERKYKIQAVVKMLTLFRARVTMRMKSVISA